MKRDGGTAGMTLTRMTDVCTGMSTELSARATTNLSTGMWHVRQLLLFLGVDQTVSTETAREKGRNLHFRTAENTARNDSRHSFGV